MIGDPILLTAVPATRFQPGKGPYLFAGKVVGQQVFPVVQFVAIEERR